MVNYNKQKIKLYKVGYLSRIFVINICTNSKPFSKYFNNQHVNQKLEWVSFAKKWFEGYKSLDIVPLMSVHDSV